MNHLYWQEQGSTSSRSGIDSRWRVFEVLWNLECPVVYKPKEKYVRISMKEVWHNLDDPSKNNCEVRSEF